LLRFFLPFDLHVEPSPGIHALIGDAKNLFEIKESFAIGQSM